MTYKAKNPIPYTVHVLAEGIKKELVHRNPSRTEIQQLRRLAMQHMEQADSDHINVISKAMIQAVDWYMLRLDPRHVIVEVVNDATHENNTQALAVGVGVG